MDGLIQIYENYEAALSKAAAGASPFSGAFGMGADDPRRHPCNQSFYDSVEKWAADFAASGPSGDGASAAVSWILEYPRERKGTYWFAIAAQKHAIGLVPFLRPEDAAQLRKWMEELYPREGWLPVQKQLAQALARRGGVVQQPKHSLWGKRVALLLAGLAIAHLGVTLFLLADLGSDPFNVLIQGLHRVSGLATHGTIHIAVCFLIILVLLAVDRSCVRIGTFLCMILGGPIIDGFSWLLGGAVNGGSPMALRIAAVVLGCGILAFGMTVVIRSEAGTGPNDLVAVVISDKTKWKFGIVRIAVDAAFALAGWCLGGTVGLGTIICVAVVGPVAQIVMPLSGRICGAVLGKEHG